MSMKPDTAQFVEMIGDQLLCPPEALTDQQSSADYLKKARSLPASAATPESVAHVEEHAVNGDVTVRIYRPEASGPLPVVIYYHGGGWVSGDLDMHDSTCRRIANRADVVVVNVDYRLAPEHAFPAAFDDAWATVEWVSANAAQWGGDPSRIAVAGSSAGGNLAAAVALRARDEGAPQFELQVLIYPVLDSRLESDSYRTNAEGYLITATQMRWYWNQYVPQESDRQDWRVSPAHASSLAGLPPAVIVVAEFDPLRDEGQAYAARLKESAVPAEVTCYEGQIHGFMGFLGVVADAELALNDLADRIRSHFH